MVTTSRAHARRSDRLLGATAFLIEPRLLSAILGDGANLRTTHTRDLEKGPVVPSDDIRNEIAADLKERKAPVLFDQCQRKAETKLDASSKSLNGESRHLWI